MKTKTEKKITKIPFITKFYILEAIEICDELEKYYKNKINVIELKQNIDEIKTGLNR